MPATIKLGDTGDDIKRLQRVFARMKTLGPEDVTGNFGPQTEQAVKDERAGSGRRGWPNHMEPHSSVSRGIADAARRIAWAGRGHAARRAQGRLWLHRAHRRHLWPGYRGCRA
jgi:hypothetical protein